MTQFFRDLLGFLVERRKFWLVPFIFVFLVLGTLIAVAQYSAVSPFIYTFF
jgi:hypothetical protein